MAQTPTHFGGGAFPTTRWTVVLKAKGSGPDEPGCRVALETLVQSYWQPLYFYVRRRHVAADAEDLTQTFFATLLEKDYLQTVERDKGRFRAFLLVALKHFLSNEYDKARAQKRGGGKKMLSLDFDSAERAYAFEPSTDETPERIYLRSWARALTAQAMARLAEESKEKGKAELFESLKEHLAGGDGYRALAEKFEMSEANLKVTVHRLRRRFAAILRELVRDTVASEAEVDGELKEILEAL